MKQRHILKKSLPCKLAKGMRQLDLLNDRLSVVENNQRKYSPEVLSEELSRLKIRLETAMIAFEKFEQGFDYVYYSEATSDFSPEATVRPLTALFNEKD